MTTPRDEGFRMPAEWGPHQATLMAWPTRTRKAFWGAVFERAREDYAAVARAVAAFEPVIMVCNPGEARAVRDRCGTGVEAIEVLAYGGGGPHCITQQVPAGEYAR